MGTTSTMDCSPKVGEGSSGLIGGRCSPSSWNREKFWRRLSISLPGRLYTSGEACSGQVGEGGDRHSSSQPTVGCSNQSGFGRGSFSPGRFWEVAVAGGGDRGQWERISPSSGVGVTVGADGYIRAGISIPSRSSNSSRARRTTVVQAQPGGALLRVGFGQYVAGFVEGAEQGGQVVGVFGYLVGGPQFRLPVDGSGRASRCPALVLYGLPFCRSSSRTGCAPFGFDRPFRCDGPHGTLG